MKKLFSLILGICTLFTSIPNVLAGETFSKPSSEKKSLNTLVIGTNESQHKFLRIMFNTEISPLRIFKEFSDENYDIKFAISKDYKEDPGATITDIEKGFFKKDETEYRFKVILATVDADQELEKVKEDMRNIVDFICDYKRPFIQILIVGCKESDKDIDFCKLSNFTCTSIESDGYEIGWGTNHDKKFSGTGQFLHFCPLYNSKKSNVVSHISRLSDKYDFYKKNNSKNNLINTICTHPVASGTIGLAGLGAVVGTGYGIYKSLEYLANKSSTIPKGKKNTHKNQKPNCNFKQ